MSPTVLRYKNYRLLFFSKEENRIHIHISSPDGEAKFWLDCLKNPQKYTLKYK
jgi:hypothetical protein